MPDRARRAKVFEELAEQYQRFRPEYPPELIEAIVAGAELRPEARLLEIGCGPGQASTPFAERGYAMLCLDPGARLIELARARLKDFPKVEFAVTTFEDWPLEPAAFDLVLAASAFHWVAADVGFKKVAAALKDTGALAIFRNSAVGEESDLFGELQETPVEEAPHLAHRWAVWSPPAPEEDETRAEILETGLFEEVAVRHFPWRKEYTADDYIGYLGTYSRTHVLPEAVKAALFSTVAEVIDCHGGVIDQPFVSTLYLAHRRRR